MSGSVDSLIKRFSALQWIVVAFSLVSPLGCREPDLKSISKSTPTSVQSDQQESLRQLQIAVDRGDWQQATKIGRTVLLHHHDDPNALELVARAAHGHGEPATAADLMIDACRVESFSSPARVQQAVATLLAVGRFFDCLELLQSAVTQHPDHAPLRRMLFDMLWGVEDRQKSLLHGRHLIRSRQFDVDLLLAIGSTESRTESADSFNELVRRNPSDNRPLVAQARLEHDRNQLPESIELLDKIVQDHPDFAPAVALFARALVESGRLSKFDELMRQAPSSIDEYPNLWIAKGDWYQSQQQFDAAARAYWEAARRDPPSRLAWWKLNFVLKQIQDTTTLGLTSEQIAAVSERLVRLTRLSQLKAEFIRSDKRSATLSIAIAEVLNELGQTWEAEAWSAIATTLAVAAEETKIAEVRNDIVKSLRRDTPWQITQSDLALRLDLSHLPQPAVLRSLEDPISTETATAQTLPTMPERFLPIRLIDESKSRSLVFSGHTGDRLDQPGVRHYQTLGCGGGAIDYDLDGWPDLYLAAAGGTPMAGNSMSNALSRNVEGHFRNVTANANVLDTDFSQGVAVGDVNEDGWPDLLVLNYGPNSLLINNADGTFTDASDMLVEKESDDQWSSSAAIADIDRNGLADVVIVNYGSGMEPVTKECRHATTQLVRACSPLVFPGVRDRFLFSNGSRLVDRTDQCGSPPVVGRGLGILVGDFGDDAGPGILIANDLTSNHYWSRSSQNGWLLEESAIPRGLGSDDRAPAQGSMGIASGDFDRDGDMDVYVTNFQSEANTYHEQVTNGLWRDRTAALQLDVPTLPMVGFGTEAVDLDNDGTLELIVTNGHVDDYPTETSSPYAQPMQIFRRENESRYVSVGEASEGDYLSQPHVGRALWTIDANRDGRTDIVVTHQTEPVALLINHTQSQGNWIELKLVGRDCSRDAIGTKVQVQDSARRHSVTAFRTAGDGYLCSNESVLRIGLGNVSSTTHVIVRWPDGQEATYENLSTGRAWLIVQDDQQTFELSK